MRPNGIAVLIPSSGRHVSIDWCAAIRQLAFPVGMNQFWYISKLQEDSPMQRDAQREMLAETAVKINAEYVMWIDDDTVPPATAINELFYELAQRPNAAICGGIYCTKENPSSPIVFMEFGAGPFWQWTVGDKFKCAGLGTGCMMVRTSVFKEIEKPWFRDTSEAGLNDFEDRNGVKVRITSRGGTDDLYFCKKVREKGYDIIAHGGILPVHIDYNDHDKVYKLPRSSYPVTSYQEKLDAVNAGLPDSEKKILLP